MLRGYFRDVNEKQFIVDIVKNGDTSEVTEVALGVPPFVTEMESEGDTIYKDAKYQAATVKIVEDDYYWWLYSKKAHEISVVLKDGDGHVYWTGYVTPNVYNNSWEGGNTEMEIECIDGLASLEYFKYEPVNGYSDKKVLSFAEVINNVLSRCECYNEYYFSANTKISSDATVSFINNALISEANFFGSKDDESETDKDAALTCKEVLEMISRFMNVTAVAFGNSVFFIDYDAIRNGVNTYYRYTIGGNPLAYTEVTVSGRNSISYTTYAKNGQNVSLGDIYNKVTVKAEINGYSVVIPEFFSNILNITKTSDYTLSSSENINNGMYGEIIPDSSVATSPDDKNLSMVCMVDRTYNPETKKYSSCNAVFVKYFKNSAYKTNRYKWQYGSMTEQSNSDLSTLNYTDTKNNFYGAVLAKFSVNKLEEVSYQSFLNYIRGGMDNTLDNWMSKNNVSNVEFSDYIMLLNPNNDHHINESNYRQYPFIQTTTTDSVAMFGGDNAYLLISGSYIYHYFDDDPYPIPTDTVDISEGRFAMYQNDMYLRCSLEFNGSYWDGNDWVLIPTVFNLPYGKADMGSDERRADATMFKELEIRNNVSWRMGTNKKGYVIKLPNDGVKTGVPMLTIYAPKDPSYYSTRSGDYKGEHYKHSVVFLKDFKIECIIGDPTYSGRNDTDTKYTNLINEDYVNALDEVEFKINTWDNKKPSLSAVGYIAEDLHVDYLDKTYNTALNDEENI